MRGVESDVGLQLFEMFVCLCPSLLLVLQCRLHTNTQTAVPSPLQFAGSTVGGRVLRNVRLCCWARDLRRFKVTASYRSRYYVSSKRRETLTKAHCVTSNNTQILPNTIITNITNKMCQYAAMTYLETECSLFCNIYDVYNLNTV